MLLLFMAKYRQVQVSQIQSGGATPGKDSIWRLPREDTCTNAGFIQSSLFLVCVRSNTPCPLSSMSLVHRDNAFRSPGLWICEAFSTHASLN